MASPLLPDVSSLVIITGPTRGFGRALVLQLAKYFLSPSMFVLIGRSRDNLENVKKNIKSINCNHVIELALLEFGDSQFFEKVKTVVGFCCSLERGSTQTLLIHNHGTFLSQFATDLLPSPGCERSDTIRNYMDVNLLHVAEFNALLLIELEKKWLTLGNRFFVINVSSLAATQAFPSWAPYCITKAARLMLFSCLAAERPGITVLQYSPGPLVTEMANEVQMFTKDEQLKTDSKTWTLIDPIESADKLVTLLSTGSYKSGQSIDYFDLPK